MSRRREEGPDGVLVVDKPPGMTSHDVIDAVRKRFRTKRVGHSGTLDPDATGVLLLGLGRATRFLSYAQASPKRYRTIAVFGVTTTTQDASGEIVSEMPVDVTEAQVREAMTSFTGDIEQIPPMVSAVKVGGEALYRKAQRGESVERAARAVTVYELELVSFSTHPPEATLEVRCSSGTYVRTLVHDLGARLGCGAHLRDLRRTENGGFSDGEAVALDALDESHLRPLMDAVRELPSVEIDGDAARLVANGRRLPLPSADLEEGAPVALVEEGAPVALVEEGAPVALVEDGALKAVYVRKDDELVPDRVVPS